MNLRNIKLDEEYHPMVNDIVKFSTILIIFNVFMFIMDPSNNTLMGMNYVQFIVFIILGLMTYWLVISKLIVLD